VVELPKVKESKGKEEVELKKNYKKKGIYYGSDSAGQNTKWNVVEYVESKKARSQQIQSLI